MELDQNAQQAFDYILLTAQFLVQTPELVRIEAVAVNARMMVFTIYTADDEVGYVIGETGRNINSLRTLVNALGRKHRMAYRVEIMDNRPEMRKDKAA